jgi:hypothetical protein
MLYDLHGGVDSAEGMCVLIEVTRDTISRILRVTIVFTAPPIISLKMAIVERPKHVA